MAIEALDQQIIAPIWKALAAHQAATGEPYRLMVTSDHHTAIALKKHTSHPVPCCWYQSNRHTHVCIQDLLTPIPTKSFTERALAQALTVEVAHTYLARWLLQKQ